MHLAYYQLERYSLWDTHWVWPSTEQLSITTLSSKAYIHTGCSSKPHSNIPWVLSLQPYKIHSCLLPRKVPPLNETSNYICTSYIISTWKRKETEESFFLLKTVCLEVSHFDFTCRKNSQTQRFTNLPSPNPWAYFTKKKFLMG